MKVDIWLKYGRIGEQYHGTIGIQEAPADGVQTVLEFEGFTFPRMMSRLAQTIHDHADVRVTISRLEVSNSSYVLDAPTVEMLRADPARAISGMSPEPRVVLVRDRVRMKPPSDLLRVGHATIAASFGDEVYCTVNASGSTECPCCGRWSAAGAYSIMCDNPACGLELGGKLVGKEWFVVSTAELLKSNSTKFYLPRAWNTTGKWITREDLRAMYETFLQEREECSQQNGPKA